MLNNIDNGINFYQGIDPVDKIKSGTRSKDADTKNTQINSSSSTQVNISDAAKRLSYVDGTPTQGRTAAQQEMIDDAALDPECGKTTAYNYATIPSTIFWDIRDIIDKHPAIEPVNKLSSTGRIVDNNFKENFYKETAIIDKQREALYYSEYNKGTPPHKILEKMIDFDNLQSRDYLEGSAKIGTAAPPS